MSTTDSPLEILNPNPSYPHDTAQFEHTAVSLCCWPWCSSCLLLNKALRHTPTLRQLRWDSGLCLTSRQHFSSLLEEVSAGGKCSDHGLLKLKLVQNRIEICFVRLECDCCTLCAELLIHAGTGAWITGQGPKKWSSSESPCFHAFKIPNQKAMVTSKSSQTHLKTKDDLYLIIVLVTTLDEQCGSYCKQTKKWATLSLFL